MNNLIIQNAETAFNNAFSVASTDWRKLKFCQGVISS
jgi:hypothetical protein